METGDGTQNGDGANGTQQGNNGGGQLYEGVHAQGLQGLRVRNMVQVALDHNQGNFSLQQMHAQANVFQGASLGGFMDSQGDQASFQAQFQNQQKTLAQTQQQQQQQLAPQQASMNPTFSNIAELYFGQQGLPSQPHMSVDPFRNQPVYDPTGSQFQQFSGRPVGQQEQGGSASQMALANGLSLVGQGGLGDLSNISNMLYGPGSAGLLRLGGGGLGVSPLANLGLNMGVPGDLLQPQLNLGSNPALLQAQQVLMQQQQQTQALIQQQAQQQQQQQQVELLLSQLHAMRQRQQQQIQALLQTHQLEQLDLLARLQVAMGGASIMPNTQPTTPTTQQQQQHPMPPTPQRSDDGDVKPQQGDANQQPTTTAPPTPQKTPNEGSESSMAQSQSGQPLAQQQPKSGGSLAPPTSAPPPPTQQDAPPPKQQKSSGKQTRGAPAAGAQGQAQEKTQHLSHPRAKVQGTTPPGTRPTSPQPTQPPQRPPSSAPPSPKHVPGAPPFPPMHMPYMPPPHIPWYPGMIPPPFMMHPGPHPGPPHPPPPMGMYSVMGVQSSERDGSADQDGSGNDSDSDRRRDDGMYSTEESEVVSQKRERNSAASTRFRMRKKQKMLELQRATQDMANKCNQLEQECAALEQDVARLKSRLTHGAEMKQEPNTDGNLMHGGQAKPYNYQEHAAKFGMVRAGGDHGARGGGGGQRQGGGGRQKQQK